MRESNRVFVAAWEYPPMASGESVVCRRTLENSSFSYDVCCGPLESKGDDHVRLFPIGGNKYLSWPFAVARQFEMLYRQEEYPVMMSRVMPPNGHLAGWLIKRRHPEIKWIAYFSDPIWNSPFLKVTVKNDGSHSPRWLVMKLFGIPCKWALKRADVLMFNNQRLAHYVLGKRYEQYRDKLLIAPYGHEGVHPRPAPARGDGKFRLTHVGQIYGNRTFAALVDGLTLLKTQQPQTYAKLELRQVGFVCEAERQRIAESAVADCFVFVDTVPYAQSIEEMYQADCLLVIDPVFSSPKKNVYIPGKLYDYLSTARPILCIADVDSATGDLAGIVGCQRVDPIGASVCVYIGRKLTEPLPTVTIGLYEKGSCQDGYMQLDKVLWRWGLRGSKHELRH